MFEVCFSTILQYYLHSRPASVEFFYVFLCRNLFFCPFLLLLIAIGWHSVVDLTKRHIIEFDSHSKQLLSTSIHDRSGVSSTSVYARIDVSLSTSIHPQSGVSTSTLSYAQSGVSSVTPFANREKVVFLGLLFLLCSNIFAG